MKLKPKTCELCGVIFEPTSGRQKCCNRPLIKKCVVCGNEFESKCARNTPNTCSNPECTKLGMSGVNNMLDPIKCPNCGVIFKPTSTKQVYCNQKKNRTCAICGKAITYTCGRDDTLTCSKECQAKLVVQQRRDHLSKQTRICKWCGKEFTPRESRDVYCYGPHYKKCAICGKEFEFDIRGYSGVQTCSKECMGKLMSENHDYDKGAETCRQNMIAKYGVSNAMNIPGVTDKIKETNKKKYGAEWYTQTQEYRDKVKQTDLEKYGVEHHLQSQEVIEKRMDTLQQEYGEGITNVFQVNIIKDKIRQTNMEKYGVEYITQSADIVNKIKQSNLEKYGETHAMKLKEFQDKAMQTNMEKYGRRAYTQQHITNIQDWYRFIDNPREFLTSRYSDNPSPYQVALDLGVDVSTIDEHLKKNDSIDCVKRGKSRMELEICAFIRSLNPEMRIVQNTRSVIENSELDIYLPDFNFAIECDPTCTHNSNVPDPWGGEPKPRRYHQDKTDKCASQGIFLMHIFGYDWSHKKDIILSMIRNKLGQASETIYARKCEVREVGGMEAAQFLDNNHRQGNASSPIRLGLFFQDELVSLMTFSKMRGTIGTGKTNLTDCYELVRFCSKLNTSVVGGASKLLSYFKNKYNPQRIRSFSDRAHTSGNLYTNLGFVEVARADTGYVWVNVESDRAYHRTNAQKQNLKKFLKDDDIDLTQTESDIMIQHGYVQVFDSGTITWEWTR